MGGRAIVVQVSPERFFRRCLLIGLPSGFAMGMIVGLLPLLPFWTGLLLLVVVYLPAAGLLLFLQHLELADIREGLEREQPDILLRHSITPDSFFGVEFGMIQIVRWDKEARTLPWFPGARKRWYSLYLPFIGLLLGSLASGFVTHWRAG
jgi:hypothetical protein